MKKPKWVIKKEKDEKTVQKKTYWIFGLHAVRDALVNQNRKKFRLMMTKMLQRNLVRVFLLLV